MISDPFTQFSKVSAKLKEKNSLDLSFESISQGCNANGILISLRNEDIASNVINFTYSKLSSVRKRAEKHETIQIRDLSADTFYIISFQPYNNFGLGRETVVTSFMSEQERNAKIT